jgi:hypothetical protein
MLNKKDKRLLIFGKVFFWILIKLTIWTLSMFIIMIFHVSESFYFCFNVGFAIFVISDLLNQLIHGNFKIEE